MADKKKGRRKNPPLSTLEDRLGYRFRQQSLLSQALTHSSRSRHQSYERLEFLGDRVLGLVVSDMLFRRFPEEAEGALAKRFADLVRRETLAKVAVKLRIGEHLYLSPGEEDMGGRENLTILSDVCEAILGAIYLDAGLNPAAELVRPHWQPLLDADLNPPRDPKSELQEWAQSKRLPLPSYKVIDQSGPSHSPEFTVVVVVETRHRVSGKGTSKRAAERAAAKAMLAEIARAERKGDEA